MKTFLTFLCLLAASASVYSQTIQPVSKKPLITVNVSGGFNLPMMDLKSGNGLRGVWDFTDYGMATGYGTAINVKFSVLTRKYMQLRVYTTLGYAHFTNDDNKAFIVFNNTGVVKNGYPTIGGPNNSYATVSETSGISDMRINVPYVAAGFEYSVYTDRKSRSCFNFGLDGNLNFITGRIYQTITGDIETFNTYRLNTRFGIGINAEYSYRFSDYVGFHTGVRYHIPNLIGKAADVSDGSAYMFLLDNAATNIHPALTSSRTMGFLNFFGGLSLYFGSL